MIEVVMAGLAIIGIFLVVIGCQILQFGYVTRNYDDACGAVLSILLGLLMILGGHVIPLMQSLE